MDLKRQQDEAVAVFMFGLLLRLLAFFIILLLRYKKIYIFLLDPLMLRGVQYNKRRFCTLYTGSFKRNNE